MKQALTYIIILTVAILGMFYLIINFAEGVPSDHYELRTPHDEIQDVIDGVTPTPTIRLTQYL